MNAKVNVLSVLDRLIGNARTTAGLTGDPRMRDKLRDGEQARAAVAELIEECERLCDAADGMKRNADGMSRRSPIALTLRTAAANILSLRAALAGVGGAK